MPPDAASVVRQQVDRDRGLRRRGPHTVDVVARRNQDVEVAPLERSLLDELERPAALRVDLFVLSPAIQADEPPGEVVVDGRLRPGQDHEREQRQRAVLGAVEEPLADPATHAALRRRRLILVREPPRVVQQLGELRLDRRASVLWGGSACNRRLHLGNERPYDRCVEDELGDPVIVPFTHRWRKRRERIAVGGMGRVHDTRRRGADRRPPRGYTGRRFSSCTAGPASVSTTCAISPRNSLKKTTSRGTSSGDRPRQPSTGRTRWRPTSTTPDASSMRSAGRRPTWSVTRGVATSPYTSLKPSRTVSSACSASIRSERSATVVGRSSTKSSSGERPSRCALARGSSTSYRRRARPTMPSRSRGCASSGLRTSPTPKPRRRCRSCEWRANARRKWSSRSTQSCRSSRRGCLRFECLSGSSTARGARCRSKPRRTRPRGFRAPGSTSSKGPVISSGSRLPGLFVSPFGGSPPTSLSASRR